MVANKIGGPDFPFNVNFLKISFENCHEKTNIILYFAFFRFNISYNKAPSKVRFLKTILRTTSVNINSCYYYEHPGS